MTDLTKITTPFGLLDKDTQDTLKAAFEAGVKIEQYLASCWQEVYDHTTWIDSITHRAKPKPVRVSCTRAFFKGKYIGAHRVECNPDGTEPTVTWEPSQ